MSSHKNYPLSMDTTQFEFCSECGMPCLNKIALKKHQYMHQNKDKFVKKTQAKGMQADFQPCGMCKKQFRSKASLDQHIRVIHHKIKGYVCHLCHKSFGYKKTLDGHISVMHENSGKVSILEVESLLPFLHGFSRWIKNTPSLYV